MSTAIRLGALLMRDGLIHLVPSGSGEWALPGGVLEPHHEDIDAAMDAILATFGVEAPAVEEDFVETIYLRHSGGVTVYNLYAPTDWRGEPPGRWLQPQELTSAGLEPEVGEAVLVALGMQERGDDTETLARALGVAPAQGNAEPLDVLRTLSGGDADAALAGLRSRYGRFADDIVDHALVVWTNPSLDRKTRSLEVIAIVAAMGGRPAALRSHLGGALNHGATPDEIRETIRMVATYAGYPAALEAWTAMDEVFAARGVGGGAP